MASSCGGDRWLDGGLGGRRRGRKWLAAQENSEKMIVPRLFMVVLLIQSSLARKHGDQRPPHPSRRWLTLSGKRPLVIARGGYSGLFPESSPIANEFAITTSLNDLILYCNLQLSKDGIGFCLSSLDLSNSTNIADVFPAKPKSYTVNGKVTQGRFSVDYTAEELSNVALIQNIFSRPYIFDALGMPMTTVEEIAKSHPAGFWLNVQYSSFYAEHKQDPTSYVLETSKSAPIHYISSPEIGFLKNLNRNMGGSSRTKLVFVAPEPNTVEPTTNLTYAALLKNLSAIKEFASGILVHKQYIWPVNPEMYLDSPTSLVTDAHNLGLEVFATRFANDDHISFNYSYDPSVEYLQFIDNSQFSIDGFLTDFPSTASTAIACLAHHKKAPRPPQGPLVISHNGASGVYPGSTDLAYQQAVDDGADIIDCSVQMSRDGIPFCLNATDLTPTTNSGSLFLDRSASIPQLQKDNGIFSFDLSWDEIKTLQPVISSPLPDSTSFPRNPANRNKGKLITLAEFLEFAKQQKVHGVLVTIRNAAYLAANKGLSVTDAVATALSNASLDKQSAQQVLIQSDDSAVLSKFGNNKNYKKVFMIEEAIGEAPKATVDQINKFADAVNVRKPSIIPSPNSFTATATRVVEEFHKANMSVFASVFLNEFGYFAYDYLTDPMVEIATFTLPPISIDGIVTEYPATASAYLRSPCSQPDRALSEFSIQPINPGDLIHHLPEGMPLPPAEAPQPALNISDVVDPPLPPVYNQAAASEPPMHQPPASSSDAKRYSAQTLKVANLGLTLMGIVVPSVLSTW
ncbi:glycerophosphodiester phosphodiesterase GDPDL7-like [Diospyros lotus]|uniref:glycerophosphodiester phosphodiesterase GDPDL7-like n=1 Tax=Diospyros lotus TaxID=55363 RepID=UPI002259B63A|nr:glycerophosphodiester phosphodiesterase GDPDL7-like [Diospyros lotus]